jgi:hypothetical protein
MNLLKARVISVFLLIHVVAFAAAELEYRSVLLKVVDETSGEPIAGVKVATEYWGDPKKPVTPRVGQGTTDAAGLVLLEVCRAAYSPRKGPGSRIVEVIYNLELKNEAYQQNGGMAQFSTKVEQSIFTRKPGETPSHPDYTFNIRSVSEQRRLAEIDNENEERDKRQAEEWHMKGPDFWPPQTNELWPNSAENLLLEKRWESASRKAIGSENELAAIKAAITENISGENPSVGEVRWLTQSVVLASGGWYGGPINAGTYFYVLKKIEGRWIVFRKYLQVIS